MSWTVINSLFSHNTAVGNGGNPAEGGTPGGGSGGAIDNDGSTMTLSLCVTGPPSHGRRGAIFAPIKAL